MIRRDGPPGRLYGALLSSEVFAKKTVTFGLVVQGNQDKQELGDPDLPVGVSAK